MPSTDAYSMGECLRDLLHLSARLLVVGGRLVFFIPASTNTYSKEDEPRHPGLRVVANMWVECVPCGQAEGGPGGEAMCGA